MRIQEERYGQEKENLRRIQDKSEEWRICEIQYGQEKEISDLAALEGRIFSDAWTENGIRETLRQNHTLALGIWKGESFAGYVILYYVLDEGEIARIAVDSAYRRQGAARALFGQLAVICKEKGIGRLMLEVRQGNQAAVSFYRKCGFTVDGIRKAYYTEPCEDAVLMSKDM